MKSGFKVIIESDDGLRKEFHLKDTDIRNREILAMWTGLSYYDKDPDAKIKYDDKMKFIASIYHLSTVRISGIIGAAIKEKP